MKKGNNLMFDLMSIKDFSKELGKPESTVRTWIRRGDIPLSCLSKIGSTVFIRTDRFKEWLDGNNL